jgi:hypothetical protein
MKMHIGIDFDNTIVTYDRVFHKYALKLGLISQEVMKNKQEIRDAIRRLPRGNDRWTELQGLVYGCYMNEAEPAKGIKEFLKTCKEELIKISIISHKTIYPALGPRVDLREAARRWLQDQGFLSEFGLSDEDILFVETLDEKLAEIAKRNCTHFIDDLVEVLLHPDFPMDVERILYSSKNSSDRGEVRQFKTWDEIQEYFFG